jgi:hypothetical protein
MVASTGLSNIARHSITHHANDIEVVADKEEGQIALTPQPVKVVRARVTVPDRARQTHDEWSQFSISFSAMDRGAATTGGAALR